MAYQLRIHVALADDPSSSPRTHVRKLTATCNPDSRGIRASGTRFPYPYLHVDTHNLIKNKINIKKNHLERVDYDCRTTWLSLTGSTVTENEVHVLFL